jgi:transcriptional regulator with XRE-family HTH domain
MYIDIGAFLRSIRTSRRLSLTALAAEAGVAKSTLSRWEAGSCVPRLPELEAVLRALAVTPETRRRALELIAAPRAVRRLREETGLLGREWGDEAIAAPTGGDLLRAMRHRSRLTVDQVAARLGVQSSTVSRWERSQTAPRDSRLQQVLHVLQARPEEREALTDRIGLLLPSEERRVVSLDGLSHRLQVLVDRVSQGDRALLDLHFLTWEAQALPLARRSRAGHELLSDAYGHRAEWLMWAGQPAQATRYARRAQTLLRMSSGAPRLPLRAVQVEARVAADGPRPAAPTRAVELLRAWLPMASTAAQRCTLYRDMAQSAAWAGEFDASWRWIARALEAARESEDAHWLRLTRFAYSEILLASGEPERAVRYLPEDTSPVAARQVIDPLTWAGALLALGDRRGARVWIDRAIAGVDAYGYMQFVPWITELAERC